MKQMFLFFPFYFECHVTRKMLQKVRDASATVKRPSSACYLEKHVLNGPLHASKLVVTFFSAPREKSIMQNNIKFAS